MTRPALTNKRVLLLLVLLMVLSSLMPPWIARGVAKYPRQAVQAFVLPFIDGLTAVSGWLRPPETQRVNLGDHERVVNENLQLQGQVVSLQQELRETQERLAMIADVQNRVGDQLKFVEARVAAQPRGASPATIVINRGTRDGVRESAVVVAGPNLVGRVVGVTPVSATVQLISAPRTLLKVVIRPPTNPTYELRANVEVSPDGDAFYATIGKDDPAQVEDLVFLIDEYWADARGAIVGKVVAIQKDPSDPELRQRVVVKPLVALDAQRHVVVMVSPAAGAPATPAESPER